MEIQMAQLDQAGGHVETCELIAVEVEGSEPPQSRRDGQVRELVEEGVQSDQVCHVRRQGESAQIILINLKLCERGQPLGQREIRELIRSDVQKVKAAHAAWQTQAGESVAKEDQAAQVRHAGGQN